MEDESDKNASRICHMCWMNKPIDEFMNRAQTRYCKICKTCRSGQLLRYYEKKKSIPKIKTLRKELSESQSSGLRISKQSSSSDSDKSIDNQQVAISIQQEDKDDSLSVTLIPFLQSRCRIVDPIIVSCDFIAKLVFHDSEYAFEGYLNLLH